MQKPCNIEEVLATLMYRMDRLETLVLAMYDREYADTARNELGSESRPPMGDYGCDGINRQAMVAALLEELVPVRESLEAYKDALD